MERQAVQSSMIRSWAFDANAEVLELEFTNGRVYRYQGVPEFLARGFEVASSKGQFFLSRIGTRYPFEEVHSSAPGWATGVG
jgi:hypothetical protein